MIGTQGLLIYRQRTLQMQTGAHQIALIPQHHGQIVVAGGSAQVRRTEDALPDLQGLLLLLARARYISLAPE